MEAVAPVVAKHFYQLIYRSMNKVVECVFKNLKKMRDESEQAHREGAARAAKMHTYKIYAIRSRPV